MTDFFISKLSKEELENLHRFTKLAYDRVKFFAYKIGPCCNATKSVPFPYADCDLHCIYHTSFKREVDDPKIMHFEFSLIYKRGFDIMRKVFSDAVKDEDFDEPSKKALEILIDFIKNQETYQKSLIKILKKTADFKKIDVVVAIAEHLLGKLCPGESVFIRSESKGKQERLCKCGCNSVTTSSSRTGIGNEYVWHGFFDIITKSDAEISSGASIFLDSDEETSSEANTAKIARLDLEDVNIDKEDDLKEEQVAAQAIVFSVIQKDKHPQLDNFLVPCTAISASHVRIFMYDSEYDVLICSEKLPIFNDSEENSLDLVTVITLWMVLNYKHFCSGIDLEKLAISLKDVKSGFAKHIEPVSKYYEAMKSCVSSFPIHVEEKLIKEGYRAMSIFNQQALQVTFP